MNKIRIFLMQKLTPKNGAAIVFPAESVHEDGTNYGRYYAEMEDGLRLYIENSEYVGYSTPLPNPEG